MKTTAHLRITHTNFERRENVERNLNVQKAKEVENIAQKALMKEIKRLLRYK
jgi:hypothetical protein